MKKYSFSVSFFPSFFLNFHRRNLNWHFVFPSFLLSLFLLVLPFAVVFAQTTGELASDAPSESCETKITGDEKPTICLAVPFTEKLVKVSGISEYIQQFYRFFVGAVLSLAIFMIVIGGVQWVFALGNPGKIGNAKRTISNAFMGVLLTFISVGMLRIINPDLITLKLPDIKSVEQVNFYGLQRCDSLPPGTKVLLEDGREVDGGVKDNKPKDATVGKSFLCGKQYRIVGTADNTCVGAYCFEGQEGFCLANTHCVYGSVIFGSIQFPDDYYIDNTDWPTLFAVCPDNKLGKGVMRYDWGPRKKFYEFPIDKDKLLGNHCSKSSQVYPKGYLLGVEVNDDSGLITVDDNRLLDRTCQRFVVDANNPNEFAGWSSGTLIPVVIADSFLFTYEELSKGEPIECNIVINNKPDTTVDFNAPGCQDCVTLGSMKIRAKPSGVCSNPDIFASPSATSTPTSPPSTDCKIERVVANKLVKLQENLIGWQVTEAWPPTGATKEKPNGIHKDPCHYNATCVDANITTGTQIPQYIYDFVKAAKDVGLRAVYEVKTQKDKDDLVQQGKKDNPSLDIGQYIIVPSGCAKPPCITAPHFSVYNQ